MTIKTFLTILLLASFFSLSAQDVASEDLVKRPIVFESVSFSTDQGSLIIICKDTEALTSFEFIDNDSHFSLEWDSNNPVHHFPMKLSFKPGKVTVKYKMRGGETKIFQLKVAAHDELKLTI